MMNKDEMKLNSFITIKNKNSHDSHGDDKTYEYMNTICSSFLMKIQLNCYSKKVKKKIESKLHRNYNNHLCYYHE